jgi:hypothetical protein
MSACREKEKQTKKKKKQKTLLQNEKNVVFGVAGGG